MFDFPRLCYGDGHARPGPFQCPAVNQLLRPILGSSVVGLVLVGRIAPGKGIDPTEPCWVGRERRFRSLILSLFNVVRGLPTSIPTCVCAALNGRKALRLIAVVCHVHLKI